MGSGGVLFTIMLMLPLTTHSNFYLILMLQYTVILIRAIVQLLNVSYKDQQDFSEILTHYIGFISSHHTLVVY